MSLNLRVNSIEISDETTVDVSKSGIIALVGPNNAGKSKALYDINSYLFHGGPTAETQVVRKVVFERAGSPEDLMEWIRNHAHEVPNLLDWYRRAGGQTRGVLSAGELTSIKEIIAVTSPKDTGDTCAPVGESHRDNSSASDLPV